MGQHLIFRPPGLYIDHLLEGVGRGGCGLERKAKAGGWRGKGGVAAVGLVGLGF